jgi:DNA-binding Lrp family transcriptional regulator
VVAPDPVDIRLLALVAESGKAAVHEIAARLGMDPREVASRLVALSGTGLPLIVGVECDPYGLRAALATAWPQPRAYPPAPPYPVQPQPRQPPQPQPPQPRPPDPISTWGPPQSSSWARGDQPTRPAWTAPPSQANPVPAPTSTAAGAKGAVGETLRTDVLEGGGQLAVQLVEVVDPADFLFSAAGYRLRDGERAVVVHTEVTNLATTPFPQLPDLCLVLVAGDGRTVTKAPVTLSSRPPHRIGPRPGETAGGHTVYVLPDSTPITSVRWTLRPDDEQHALVWAL